MLRPHLIINSRNQFDRNIRSQGESSERMLLLRGGKNLEICMSSGNVGSFLCEQCPCFLCVHLWSEPVVFIGVAVDGHTAVVGDGPRHGRYAHDNARRRVVTQDGVRGFAVFSSAAKNEDLPVAH